MFCTQLTLPHGATVLEDYYADLICYFIYLLCFFTIAPVECRSPQTPNNPLPHVTRTAHITALYCGITFSFGHS